MFILIGLFSSCGPGEVYDSLQHVGGDEYCVAGDGCAGGTIFKIDDTGERYCGNCMNGADKSAANICTDIYRSEAYVFDLDEIIDINQCKSRVIGRKRVNGGFVRYCATCAVYPREPTAVNDTEFQCPDGCGSIDDPADSKTSYHGGYMYTSGANSVPYCVDCAKQDKNNLFFLSWIGDIRLYECRSSCQQDSLNPDNTYVVLANNVKKC